MITSVPESITKRRGLAKHSFRERSRAARSKPKDDDDTLPPPPANG